MKLTSACAKMLPAAYEISILAAARKPSPVKSRIPSSGSRERPFAYDKALYHQRHKVENLFAKLKDWRCIATRCGRYAHASCSATCIAATVIFWL